MPKQMRNVEGINIANMALVSEVQECVINLGLFFCKHLESAVKTTAVPMRLQCSTFNLLFFNFHHITGSVPGLKIH